VEELRSVWGGVLKQESDEGFPELGDLKVVTKRAPSPDELEALELAWRVCKHVRSNAIVFADAVHTLGIGAGQMSRIDSVEVAIRKATKSALTLVGCERRFLPVPRWAGCRGTGWRDGSDSARRESAGQRGDRGGRRAECRDGVYRKTAF
jgi:hypothetical protein